MKASWIIGITGASGVVYGVRLVQVLAEMNLNVITVISESARLVIHEELGIRLKSYTSSSELKQLFGPATESYVSACAFKDFSAPIASGSFPTSGMVIIPCSMGTLGAVANGLSQNLIHRAADCALKEGRKLILVPRETPLNAIHLENMLKLARLGVKIVPAMPGFYSANSNVSELVDFVVGKTLDQMDLKHALYPRWIGKQKHETQGAGL